MAALPGVSVVIPTYNRADILGEALDSVFARTPGSSRSWSSTTARPTETPQLLEDASGSVRRTPAVLRQPNAGESAARNEGIRVRATS